MSKSLAVKYRPTDFSEVIGQSVITTILEQSIEQDRFSNAILFAGPSGTGKTTLARIFANKINRGLGKPIEIDAASNNGVDQVRAILDDMSSRALVGEYKVYIIDEAHMITKEGWNAFLKGIEECPKYTVLLFCTTEPNKIPATILNRVQRYDLGKIPAAGIKSRLEYISEREGFANYSATCDVIAKTCQGGMRDAIATLERCAGFSTDLKLENTKRILGESNFETMFKLTWAIQKKNESQILAILDELSAAGGDLRQFVGVYLDFVLDLEKYILSKDISLTSIPEHLASESNPVIQFTTKGDDSLDYFIKLSEAVLNIKQAIKYDSGYKSTIAVLLIRFSREER